MTIAIRSAQILRTPRASRSSGAAGYRLAHIRTSPADSPGGESGQIDDAPVMRSERATQSDRVGSPTTTGPGLDSLAPDAPRARAGC
jgi:hypothetical protein